ncbi:hypothetical protein [Halosimplex sp. J119]
MRLQSTAVVAIVAITVLAVVPSSLVAANGYQISSGDADSMPERTVEFQDSTFTIDSLITADPGDEVSVDVSAPDEVYRVYIYNSEEQIVDSKRGDGGDQSFTFDLSGYDPGSYPITVYHDGDYMAVQPLVVEGYDVSVDAPSSVEQGETATVEIEVDQTAASSSPAHVRAVVANDDEELVVDASESGGTYEATFNGSELNTGSYTVYGAAQGSTTIMDRNELLGVSGKSSLSVDEASTATPTATPTPSNDGGGDGGDGGDGGAGGGGGGGGGGDGGAAEDTETPTPTATAEPNSTDASPTPTATATPTATDASNDETPTDTPVETTTTDTPTETATVEPTDTSTDVVETTEPQTPTDTSTATQTDDGIEPASPESPANTAEEAQTGTADSGPGFTMVGTGLAVLAGAILLIRRD